MKVFEHYQFLLVEEIVLEIKIGRCVITSDLICLKFCRKFLDNSDVFAGNHERLQHLDLQSHTIEDAFSRIPFRINSFLNLRR